MVAINKALLDAERAAVSDSKREAVAYRWIRNGIPESEWRDGTPTAKQIEAQEVCNRMDDVNWTIEYAVPATALADMQRRLEALADEMQSDQSVKDAYDDGFDSACKVYAARIRALLRGDGKGEGEL